MSPLSSSTLVILIPALAVQIGLVGEGERAVARPRRRGHEDAVELPRRLAARRRPFRIRFEDEDADLEAR